MAKSVIKRDFRASKMDAGCHFVKQNFQFFIISRTPRHVCKMCLMGISIYNTT